MLGIVPSSHVVAEEATYDIRSRSMEVSIISNLTEPALVTGTHVRRAHRLRRQIISHAIRVVRSPFGIIIRSVASSWLYTSSILDH